MSLDALSQSKLPINRKERFYTGTVLPAIICHNEFQDFGKFLDLVGVSGVNVNPDPVNANLQFFTEYGLAEFVIGDDTRRRFPDLPPERDIPDIVILIDKYIVAIEAKMYDSVSARQINIQMNRQWKLLNYLSNLWNIRSPTYRALAAQSGRRNHESIRFLMRREADVCTQNSCMGRGPERVRTLSRRSKIFCSCVEAGTGGVRRSQI